MKNLIYLPFASETIISSESQTSFIVFVFVNLEIFPFQIMFSFLEEEQNLKNKHTLFKQGRGKSGTVKTKLPHFVNDCVHIGLKQQRARFLHQYMSLNVILGRIIRILKALYTFGN